MTWDDPIVAEVRQIREKLMEDAGGFDAYVKKLQELERLHPENLTEKIAKQD